MSFERILPFLRPIESVILDETVSEVMVNGNGTIFAERAGRMAPVEATIPERSLQVAVKNIARALGDDIGDEKPILDARLPNGSRVAAVLPPCSIGGTTLTIRKFQSAFFDLGALVSAGCMPQAVAVGVKLALRAGENVLISGATGSGKTTLLNALAATIPESERLLVIEETAEISLRQINVVRLEARREQPGAPAISMRDLLRAALRHRPDRIILGEVRGGEAFDLLQALNTGHSGSLSTIHANSARQALARFTSCALQSDVDLPYKAVRANIADSVGWVVHLVRSDGRREVAELLRLVGYDYDTDRFEAKTVYQKGA
jgi:pilus assembly protein CpaF